MGLGSLLRGGRPSPPAAVLVLLVALVVIGAGAALRSTEYDETYTRLVTSPTPRPDWPATPFTPADARPLLDATTDPVTIARNLRDTDVHPPLYFWLAGAWRQLGGTSIEAMRALSVGLTLGAIAAFMGAAAAAGLPAVATGLGAALAYGFAYTGGVARGFALAHLLLGLATLAIVLAWRDRSPGRAALGGLAAGGASFANYLAAFPAAAVVGWLVLAPMLPWRRRLGMLAAAALPFLVLQGANLYFFLAQRDSRQGQFEAFEPFAALKLLGQFNAANLFGGLPLYFDGVARLVVAAGLVALLAGAALAVALRWGALGPTRWLWLGGFVAPSAGLLALGAAFGSLPIELRYLSFAAPFAAALLAGAAMGWSRRLPRLAPAALVLVLAVQAVGAAGMILHPATRQTYRDALAAVAPALGPGSLLLVPQGNDGVGLVGAVLAEAAPDQRLLVLHPGGEDALAEAVAGADRVVLLAITDRDGAVQAESARRVLAADRRWAAQPEAWRDQRRGFAVMVFMPATSRSGMAHRTEGVVVGGADNRREQP